MIERTQTETYAHAAQEDRSAHRSRISIPATLRASGGKTLQTAVRDLSLSGYSATAITRIVPGTICWLTFPGMEAMRGKVVWWNNGHLGCAFDHLLNEDEVTALNTRWDVR